MERGAFIRRLTDKARRAHRLAAFPILLTLATLATSVASSQPVPAPEPTHDTRRLVILTGDSITEGVFNDASIFIPPGTRPVDQVCWEDLCFAAQVREALEELAAASGEQLPLTFNLGLGGATSRDWDPNDFRREDVHFIFNPGPLSLFYNIPASDVVVHYVGTNDAVSFFEAGPPPDGQAFGKMVFDYALALKRRGVRHVFLTTPPIPNGWLGTPQGEKMREYAAGVRRACAAIERAYPVKGCLIDLQPIFPSDGWEGGAIHPNTFGHAFIADVYLEHIAPLIVGPDLAAEAARTCLENASPGCWYRFARRMRRQPAEDTECLWRSAREWPRCSPRQDRRRRR